MAFHTQTRKYAGLSALHDVAAEAQGIEFYPVKRRPWDTRKLRPNWDGIRWLESDSNDFEYKTEIDYEENLREGGYPELVYLYASGRSSKSYPRPMFQILPRDAFNGYPQRIRQPCADCWDFHRSWTCPEHGEREYNHERRCFLSPQQVELDERDRAAADAFADAVRALGNDRYADDVADWLSNFAPAPERTAPPNGLLNTSDVRPVLGTDRFEVTVEGEVLQVAADGSRTATVTIEVERNG